MDRTEATYELQVTRAIIFTLFILGFWKIKL